MAWYWWDAYYTQLAAEHEASRGTGVHRPTFDQRVTAPEHTRPRHDFDQATRHREVIRGVDPFSYEDARLGRSSTPEEVAFLATVVHGFGF